MNYFVNTFKLKYVYWSPYWNEQTYLPNIIMYARIKYNYFFFFVNFRKGYRLTCQQYYTNESVGSVDNCLLFFFNIFKVTNRYFKETWNMVQFLRYSSLLVYCWNRCKPHELCFANCILDPKTIFTSISKKIISYFVIQTSKVV